MMLRVSSPLCRSRVDMHLMLFLLKISVKMQVIQLLCLRSLDL